ncbi:MAG: hypothetical protein WCI72_00790 [archaeon]
MKLNKKGEFNFVLIFAIVAGSMILLLAIYGAVKAGSGLQKQTEFELAKSLDIITNPLQAGFAEGSTSRITFRRDTRINNECDTDSKFGENVISVQTKASVGQAWTDNPGEYKIFNKYLFSNFQEGKTFYVYSKPFYTGYKVTDLIFMSTEDYCFVFPPKEIEEEVSGLNVPNIGLQLEEGNNTCSDGAKKICFGTSGCEITVKGECSESRCSSAYDFGYITDENGTRTYYSGSLIYAALLSDKNVYECNVKRLLYRSSRVADILSRKIDLMSMRGCSSLLKTDLDKFAIILQNASAKDLESVYYLANDLEKKNLREGGCKLW